ncbi:MAG: hypothetical protein JWP08_2401 [Bryobacterales bacterium]|nr:hypothetical protein [Bryobacterales bacterium]
MMVNGPSLTGYELGNRLYSSVETALELSVSEVPF